MCLVGSDNCLSDDAMIWFADCKFTIVDLLLTAAVVSGSGSRACRRGTAAAANC